MEEEGLAAAEGVVAALAWKAATACDSSAEDVEGAIMKPGSLLCTALPSDANLPCQPLYTASTEGFLERRASTNTMFCCLDQSVCFKFEWDAVQLMDWSQLALMPGYRV